MVLDLSRLDACLPAVSLAVPPMARITMFEEDPAQPRIEFADDAQFAAFAADIAARGVLQPIVVRRQEDGRLRIRFGARRYRAALRAGLETLPYVETEDERQLDDYSQVAENQYHLRLQPLELGRFVLRKLAAGETRRAVAAKLHIDPSAVTHLLALAHEPPPLLLELYHGHRCRAPYTLYLLRKLIRRNAALVEQIVAEAAVVDLALIGELTARLTSVRVGEGAACAPDAVVDAGAIAGPSLALLPGPVPVTVPATLAGGAAGPSVRAALKAQSPRRQTAAVGVGQAEEWCLLGLHSGRAVELLLSHCEAHGAAWVRYQDDGARRQIPLADLQLTELRRR
ncbi:ParB/RepB/Spo0J family partition protein [Duganella sp. BuS-21]|uniref:ParB/RepB/Spo0J family partition protein n=1 Tax=Duganella sp. BuS-21 TaxID=2943848 RepID=UPI0035A7249E